MRARFRSAALAGTRANVPASARTRTGWPDRRSRCTTGTVWFERKLAGGMAFEDSLRDWANRLRYARAST